MFSWFQKKQTSLSKNLRQTEGFCSLQAADFSDRWDEEHFLKSNLTSGFSAGKSSGPLSIGYSLIHPTVMFDRSVFELDFSKYLNNLNNKTIKEAGRIKAAVNNAEIRHKTLKKLHSAIESLNYECREEGFDFVSDQAKQNAKRILNAVYSKFPEHEYHIYPTEDREIALDFNPQKGKGVLILCDSKNGAAYFSTFSGRNTRFRCDCIDDFPYEHLWKIFKQLDKKSISIHAVQEPASAVQNKSEAAENSNNAVVSYTVCRKPSFSSEILPEEYSGSIASGYA